MQPKSAPYCARTKAGWKSWTTEPVYREASALVYAELPENEALTMSLAATVGIEVLFTGSCSMETAPFLFCATLRPSRLEQAAFGDFAQLSGASRDTKYDSSTEQLIEIIDKFCTFPA